MSTKTMKKGHGVAAAVALIAAVFTLSVNAATWFTEKATTFNAEGYGTWTASEGATLTDIVQVGDTSLAIDADGAELTYTPAKEATGDVQTVTLKVCFSAAYDDLDLLKPEGGFGLVAYDKGDGTTVYAVYNGSDWVATETVVTDVETATHTITITTDGKYVTYKEIDDSGTETEIAKIASTIKPTSFSFKGTGVLHDDFTGDDTVLAVPLVPPTLDNATVSPREGSFAPGAEVEFTFMANAGYLFANGEKTLKLTGTIDADGKVTFETEPEAPTTAAAKIGDNEYLTLAAAVDAAAANDTITLLKDTSGAGLFISKGMTIDLGSCTYNVTGPAVGSTGTESQGLHIETTAAVTVMNGTITSTAGSGVKMLVQNYTSLTLTNVTLDGTYLDASNIPFYTLSNNSGDTVIGGNTSIIAHEGDNAYAFDVDKTANVTLNTTGKITGKIDVTGTGKLALEAGDLSEASVGFNGKGTVTKADKIELAAPAGYKWVEGVLTPCEYVAEIDGVKYESLAEAVAAADGGTITLLKDTSGAGLFISKGMTIDLGGFTYNVTGPAVGSTGTESQGLHIETTAAVTVMNGTITSTAGSGVKMLVQNYTSLTLTHVTLDGTNLDASNIPFYTLSNNSGDTVIGGSTSIIAHEGDNAYAFDVDKTANVTLNTTGKITGKIDVTGTGTLALEAGDLTDASVGFNGKGTVTKADTLELAAPAGYVWDENGKLVAVALPTATVTGITAEGYEVAVKFMAGNIGVGYDDWKAEFVLTSDVAIGADEIQLGGSYDANEGGKWVDIAFPGCEAGGSVNVLGLVGYDDISVKAVFDVIKSFKCGVKNLALKNDATFSLKLVITDGKTTKDICAIDNLKVEKKQAAYPEDWPTTDPETQAKFATWAAGKGAGADLTTPAAQEAFLLNCSLADLAAEEAAFKITAFTGVKDSIATPTVNTDGEAYNGTIVTKAFSDVACKNEVEPSEQAALFFKAFLTFPTAE